MTFFIASALRETFYRLSSLNPNFARVSKCHYEERSDEVISLEKDCFAIDF